MKIKQITDQNRRDFRAIYVCEGCGNKERRDGYDDANFHQNVIPDMRCKKCGESAIDLKVEVNPKTTKYAAHEVA